jgi:hypothetical protein
VATTELTFLQIVNRVLSRMRESAVTNYNDTDYSTHIGHVVNQVKGEMEEAWYWNSLRQTFTVAAVNPTVSYSLTDTSSEAVVLDAWNRTHGNEITRSTNRDFNLKFFGTPVGQSVAEGVVSQFVQTGLDANYDIVVDVYPVPDSAQTLVFNTYVPQADLSANGDIPRVPQNVLIEEVVMRMRAERGDEGVPQPQPGDTFILTTLLARAIADDQSADGTETDWEPE